MKVIKTTNATLVVNHSLQCIPILERHLHTVHDGYEDYKCKFCDKSFSKLSSLKKHIHKNHEGQVL